jgi:hypothetical protein
MNSTRAVVLFAIVFSAPLLRAQQSFWETKDAYLSQTPPTDTPQIFAPGLLADSGTFVMGRVAFSQDGTEFYYTQNDSWESGAHAKLKMMRFANGGWSKPTIVGEQFLSPTFSLDGKTLFMRQGGMRNLWKSTRQGDGWTQPAIYLAEPFGIYDYMPTLSGTAYIGSEPDADDAKNGIQYSFSTIAISANGITVKSLGRPLNEPGFNGDLYISPDESYMILSAKETRTFESELYISFRRPDRSWTTPVSLGPKINDGLAHRWGQYVTPEGKYLFYSHGTSEKDCAVYWVRFDTLLATLKSQQLSAANSVR